MPANNKGTTKLRKASAPEILTVEVMTKAQAAASSPEANAKKAAWWKGRPIHPNTRAALERARHREQSAEERRKRSETHKRRGTRPPAAGPAWTADEDALLGKMSDEEVARQTGRSLVVVQSRRHVLRIEKFGRRRRGLSAKRRGVP